MAPKYSNNSKHLIEYFTGRLYVARNNQIWFSDPMALMRTDRRRNFKQLPSRITLMSAVEDGIYVSDLERAYFMGGGDPGEAILIDKADYPAIAAMAEKIDGDRVGGLGLGGESRPVAIQNGNLPGGERGSIQKPDRRALLHNRRILIRGCRCLEGG